jgi:hypothetical protein
MRTEFGRYATLLVRDATLLVRDADGAGRLDRFLGFEDSTAVEPR